MNTRLFTALAVASTLTLGANAAHADMASCKANFSTLSNDWRTTGKQFQASDTIPGVATGEAYTRVYRAVMDRQPLFTVRDHDQAARTISVVETPPAKKDSVGHALFEVFAGTTKDKPVDNTDIVMITLDPSRGGTKISAKIMTKPGYPNMTVAPDAYCEIIESASVSN